MKKCNKCGIEKERSDFFKSGRHASGKEKIRGDCKSCASRDTASWREKNRSHYNKYMGDWRTKNPDNIRAIDMKRKYGLTIEKYKQMLMSQNYTCRICEKGPTGKRPLAIDHCHSSGKVRGLLCCRCNTAISILDNKDHLEKAIAYLNS